MCSRESRPDLEQVTVSEHPPPPAGHPHSCLSLKGSVTRPWFRARASEVSSFHRGSGCVCLEPRLLPSAGRKFLIRKASLELARSLWLNPHHSQVRGYPGHGHALQQNGGPAASPSRLPSSPPRTAPAPSSLPPTLQSLRASRPTPLSLVPGGLRHSVNVPWHQVYSV